MIQENYYTDKYLRTGEPDFATRNKILEKRARRLRETGQTRIADRLTDCSRDERCDLAVCPHCSAAFQRYMIEQIAYLWPDMPLTKVTWVLAEAASPLGELSCRTPNSLKRMFRRYLDHAGVLQFLCIGFIDLSVNIHSGRKWEAHWQPHLELITPTANWEMVRRPLMQEATKNPSVRRPIRGVPINDLEHQGSYAFKPDPGRKTFFDSSSSRAYPTKQNLSTRQEKEFLLWLADNPPEVRRFMLGVRSYGGYVRSLNGG